MSTSELRALSVYPPEWWESVDKGLWLDAKAVGIPTMHEFVQDMQEYRSAFHPHVRHVAGQRSAVFYVPKWLWALMQSSGGWFVGTAQRSMLIERAAGHAKELSAAWALGGDAAVRALAEELGL